MALASQIDAAVRQRRKPIGLLVFDRQVVIAPGDEPDEETLRSFAVGLCDAAIRHTCTANEPNPGDPCTHPDHKRDVDDARQALILAGIVPDPIPSADANRRISRDVTPIPEVIRAAKRREAEAKNPPAPLPDLSWQLNAACRGEDPELFHGPDGERAQERIVREAHAKAICMSCPVVSDCRKYAMENREQGVWGGLNDEDRTNVRRRRALKKAA